MNRRFWIFFTLILLITLAVISAIWHNQIAAANRAASLRNLQQWGIALTLYLMDHDSQLPEIGSAPIASTQTRAWYNALPPYLSQKPLADVLPNEFIQSDEPSIWIDPSSKKSEKSADKELFQYGMNRYLQPDPTLPSFTINELQHPSKIIFLTEVASREPFATPKDIAYRRAAKPTAPNAEAFVTFADGHVASVERSRLSNSADSLRAAAASEGKISWFKE
ncbi:MAG: hypothetical protein ACK5LK_03625 [Chthoniobacterales bacterium]